jgi:hypothetical protein
MKAALVLLIFLISTTAFGAELTPDAKNEIAYLFSHMETSGCEFNRNDSWHNATDASAHIQKKYQYLIKWDMLSSAESFIAGAATQSSITGQAYLVRCPGAPVIESSSWFRAALEKYRQSRLKAPR